MEVRIRLGVVVRVGFGARVKTLGWAIIERQTGKIFEMILKFNSEMFLPQGRG